MREIGRAKGFRENPTISVFGQELLLVQVKKRPREFPLEQVSRSAKITMVRGFCMNDILALALHNA